VSDRSLAGLAWANVGLHLAALAGAAVGIRPGSPLVPLTERLNYLASAPLGWTLAWVAWMLAALALIGFLAAVTRRLPEPGVLADLGLMVAVAGAAFDFFCDAVYILVFPMLASWQPDAESLFLVLERVTGIASLVIANGAYAVATLLFTLALRHHPGVSLPTTCVGCAVAGFGLLLAAAGFTGEPLHAEMATAPTIGLFCVWVVLVARSLQTAGRRP
jgi:hypothetical protein